MTDSGHAVSQECCPTYGSLPVVSVPGVPDLIRLKAESLDGPSSN